LTESSITTGEIIHAYWWVAGCSFAVSLVAGPLCRRAALHWNIVDRPDDWLKPHGSPIPYLGGLGILVGWVAGLMLALLVFPPNQPHAEGGLHPILLTWGGTGILLAGVAATIIGLVDDIQSIRPGVKLAGLVFVAAILMGFGMGHDGFLGFVQFLARFLPEQDAWFRVGIAVVVTVLVVAGSCNAVNLIDGLDGLCAGVMGIAAAGFLVLAVHMHLYGNEQLLPLNTARVVLSFALMGASLGFLPYNRSPARMFMGDAGSMLLGFNAAVLILLFAQSHQLRWLCGALMVFGLPIGDMYLTLIRRARAGRPLMLGDRSHFYDQLVDRGWSVRRVVHTSYAISLGFAALGCLAIVLRTRYLVPLYIAVIVALAIFVARIGMLRVDSRPSKQSKPLHTV